MNWLYKILLIASVLFVSSCPALLAQDEISAEDELYKLKIITLSAEYVAPRGNYKTQLGDTGWGVSYSSLKEMKIEQPFFLGYEIYWNSLFSVSDFIQGSNISIEERVSVGSLGLNLVYRYFPSLNLPLADLYIDGHAGGRFLYSLNRSFDQNSGQNIDFFISERDFVVSYGASLGLQVDLGKNNYFLDISASYSAGTSGSYDGKDDSLTGYALKNSTTNLVRFKIGLTYIN